MVPHTALDNELEPRAAPAASGRAAAYPEHVEIVVKLAERCNIACSYCYFFFKEDQTYADRPGTLQLGTCDALCHFLEAGIRECSVKSVRICFHGGEPLLIGPRKFNEICQRITNAIADKCRLRFTIQTNGMLIDEAWVNLIGQWHCGVGVSLDGDKTINDAHRIDRKRRGTYDRAAAGLQRLAASSARGSVERPGLISVINPSADGGATYWHFRDSFDVRNFSFLFMNETHDTVTPKLQQGSLSFLEGLTLAWLKENRRDVRVRLLSENLSCLMTDASMATLGARKESVAAVVSVRSDGELGADDTVAALAPDLSRTGLRVSHNSLADVFGSAIWRELDDALLQPTMECQNCEWYGLCRGGRLIHRFSHAGRFANKSIYCEALKNLYTILSAYLLKHGMPREVLKNRLARGRDAALTAAYVKLSERTGRAVSHE